MKMGHAEENVELLRATVVSLEGIQLFSSSPSSHNSHRYDRGIDDDDDDEDDPPGCSGRAAIVAIDDDDGNNDRTVSAWAGFRTSFPPEDVVVPAPACSTLFATNDDDVEFDGFKEQEGIVVGGGVGGSKLLLAVSSEEARWREREECHFGMALRWHHHGSADRTEDHRKASSDVATEMAAAASRRGDDDDDNAVRPHLEIKLPSPTSSSAGRTKTDAIEFRICVVCTSSSSSSPPVASAAEEHNSLADDEDFDDTDNDDDDGSSDERRREEGRHVCHGVARLELDPSDLVAGAATGRRIVVLPVRQQQSDSGGGGGVDYGDDDGEIVVAFRRDATLAVRLERATVPARRHAGRENEQRHYVESDWDALGCEVCERFSEMHGDTEEEEEEEAEAAKGGKRSGAGAGEEGNGFVRMCRRVGSAMATMTTPTKGAKPTAASLIDPIPKIERRDEMVGKIVETTESQSGPPPSGGVPTNNPDAGPTRPKPNRRKNSATKAIKHPSSGRTLLSQKLSRRFLCGMGLPDLGDALRTAAAAGHHCDEDHVGLYVVDTESMGSSINTRDVLGF